MARSPTTVQGPASSTVTGNSSPFSVNTWVIPIFLASSPLVAISELDLDVHAGGQVEPHQRVHHFWIWVQDVDDPLVGPHLELLARVLVDERGADHRPAIDLGGQRDGAGRRCIGTPRRIHDLVRGLVEDAVIVGLQPDADLLGHALLDDLDGDARTNGAAALA